MAEAKTAVANKPVWIDLATSDPEGAREFYAKLFGWKIEVNPDPQYGGYAMATVGGHDVAGIGGKMMEEQPTSWSVYIGTSDAKGLVKKVEAAGGKVIAPPMEVGPQGTMAVFQDPSGAFLSAWQPKQMGGFHHEAANTFGWAELNSRDLGKALAFYKKVFGWTEKVSKSEGEPAYTEFKIGDVSIAGAMDMNPMVPAEVPSYWMAYFNVSDLDQSFSKAIDAGAKEIMPPSEMGGERFAILSDPQGATFGLLQIKK